MNSNLIVIVMLAVVLGALGYNYHITNRENRILRQDVQGLNNALRATIDTTRNNYNQMRAETQTIVLSENASRQVLSSEIQNIRHGFGVKLNGIEQYTKAGLKYQTPIVVKSRDTIIINKLEKVYTVDETRYGGMLYTRNDSLLGNIFFKDTVRIVVGRGKRERWWKIWEKRPLVTNAFMSNPNGSITTLNSVIVK
jgi:hypothetical protein